MAIAESLKSSEDELRTKKVPDSYAEKYRKEETKTSAHVSNLVDSLLKESTEQEKKTLKVPEYVEKSQRESKKNY